jgi:hypothetical protein
MRLRLERLEEEPLNDDTPYERLDRVSRELDELLKLASSAPRRRLILSHLQLNKWLASEPTFPKPIVQPIRRRLTANSPDEDLTEPLRLTVK